MDKYSKILFLAVVIGLFGTYFLIIQKPLYVDENTHFFTISNFCRFNYSFPDFLTTIPGYHFFGGLFGYLTSCTESSIRFFNLLISFASIFVFYNICKELGLKNRKEKILQFVLLPILFPFFVLIYTDVLSLLFVLSMLYFGLKEEFVLSGIFGLLSFFVRQNNVIWIMFMVGYIFFDRDNLSYRRRKLFTREFLEKIYPYVVVFLLAGLFIMKNGGFSLGDKDKHPTLFFGPMNIYTFLFFFFWINLPENIINFRKIGSWIKNLGRKNIGLFVILGVLFFALFLLTFKVDHPYNNYELYHYFLRNKILHFFDSSLLLEILFFLCVVYSILSLYQIRFSDKRAYLVYAFSFIFLGMSWLIESRYFIIPFVFVNLLAIRKKPVEKYLIIWYLLINVVYLYLFYINWTFW